MKICHLAQVLCVTSKLTKADFMTVDFECSSDFCARPDRTVQNVLLMISKPLFTLVNT